MKYEFTLILKGDIELTEELADQLFEAGCDDATPGKSEGKFVMDFHRESPTLEDAIRSAIADVASTGNRVERVEIHPESVNPAP